eukprot:TRINITY_DN6803_c0_g1_i1.p1 TRINITY_DN6803_c0_g1~~TRINITY_DN6803_c0_g1_i1.p1  ORF type:complete len:303 (+),score=51.36 TRINITY_DN6803_c0_g1_i1:134-1042(+)
MVFGLFECSGLGGCVESTMFAVIVTATVYKFYKAYKKITEDTSNIIDETDRMIFNIAFAQTIVLVLFCVFDKSSFLLYTLKGLRMAQDILVCTIIAMLCIDESYHPALKRASFVSMFADSFIWFVAVFGIASHHTYECDRAVWLFYAFAIFSTSILSLYLGNQVAKLTRKGSNEYIMMLDVSTASTEYRGLQILNLDEMQKRKRQVELLVISNVVSASIQFLWDFISYVKVQSVDECLLCYEATSTISIPLFLLAKCFMWLFPTWTVYYIFYYQNQVHYKALEEQRRRTLSIFNDDRSEIVV